jgi:hypothetical protein
MTPPLAVLYADADAVAALYTAASLDATASARPRRRRLP